MINLRIGLHDRNTNSTSKFFLLFFLLLFFSSNSSRAQFWHTLPSLKDGTGMNVCFSNDEKKVFYLSKEGGVPNIWCMTVADKYGRIIAVPANPPVQVTKFTDRGVARFLHLLNKDEVLYMRMAENGKDYHIYRLKDDGTGTPQDLTPGAEGVTSEIIGASYNGRYVYYTNNKVNHDKLDTYRYDCNQYVTDLVFPNDKDFRTLAWSRDHGSLLVEEPATGSLMLFNIESTERTPLVKPANGRYQEALMDPSNHELIVLEKNGTETTERSMDIASKTWKDVAKGDFTSIDFSTNGKYQIVEEGKKWSVKEAATGTTVSLPDGAQPLSIAPKETMLVYGLPQADAEELYLYDISKKSSVKLTTIGSK